jgi:hypothetical protein
MAHIQERPDSREYVWFAVTLVIILIGTAAHAGKSRELASAPQPPPSSMASPLAASDIGI